MQVLVGTIASTRVLNPKQGSLTDRGKEREHRLWASRLAQAPLSTILVDEAASVPECCTPLLLRLKPNTLVLVGDHHQLAPFSQVPPKKRPRQRSLLQRYAERRGGCHMLTVCSAPKTVDLGLVLVLVKRCQTTTLMRCISLVFITLVLVLTLALDLVPDLSFSCSCLLT